MVMMNQSNARPSFVLWSFISFSKNSIVTAAAAMLAAVLCFAAFGPAALGASWSNTGSMATARGGHTATLLSNGKVLVAGGYNAGTFIATAELYDPATGIWSATGSMAAARSNHTATLLANGKVLVAGGQTAHAILVGAELYDPTTGTWSATGSLAVARSNYTATLLQNGKAVAAGGPGVSSVLDRSVSFQPVRG